MNGPGIRPQQSELAAPFWEAAARHELVVQRCAGCGRLQWYPRWSCTTCGATALGWAPVTGRGRIHSFTVARVATHPAFAGSEPLVIALVDLEEGPRMTTNIVCERLGDLRIGAAVEVCFDDVGEGLTLPRFRLPDLGAV